jgi:hypothetical protein
MIAAGLSAGGHCAGRNGLLTGAGLPVFYRLPKLIIDDPQFRHLGDPALGRVPRGDAFAGRWILHVAQAVPDQATDIKLVIQDAGAALGIAVDGAWPQPTQLGPGAPDVRICGVSADLLNDRDVCFALWASGLGLCLLPRRRRKAGNDHNGR